MRAAALALALAGLAAPALAQDARLRSGEHDTFARLVIYLPGAAEYEVEAAEGTFAIDFGGDFGFDASEVFRYIPQTRIAGVKGESGRLSLDLACDCVVTVERLSDSIVFLDVNDPGTVAVEAAPEPAEKALPAPQPIAAPAIRLPLIAPEATATLLPWGLDLPETATAALEATATDEPPAAYETSDTTRAIAEQIARAAAQDLLDVRPVHLPLRPEPRPALEADAEPAEPQEPQPVGTRRHVSIRTSVDEALDRDVADALSDLGMTGPCLADEVFAVSDWMPADIGGIAAVRSGTVGEFDRADAKGVASLARAYVAMGFGAEARLAIDSFRVNVPDGDILLAMADIVDDGAAGVPGRLAQQYDCPGAGALWAALASTRIPADAELDIDAVALAFSGLPPHLRTHLGPILAERLLDYGAVDTASVIRSAILRAPGTPTVETELLTAAIAHETSRDAEGDAKLAEVVDATSGRSAEAVERLIARRIEAGEPVEDELLAAAAALVYEHRGTPLAHRLTELRIGGLAASGQARQALALLAESRRHLSAETADRLRGVAYAEAARQLDDAGFLLVAVNASRELGTSPEQMAARRAVARRLTEMELYALADTLGVPEGRTAVAAAPGQPLPTPPALRAPMPEPGEPLERTAALIEHSAALRARLAAALEGETTDTQ